MMAAFPHRQTRVTERLIGFVCSRQVHPAAS
jgi:hypothetical protein